MKARVLSLGAGVQSSALYLMYVTGKLKSPPDFAVFADTQSEPQKVYDWLQKLIAFGGDKLPVVVATKGCLATDFVSTAKRFVAVPMFILNGDGTKGIGRRQCTREYKIDVVHQAMRARLGYKPRQRLKHRVEMVLGISTDEASRMKPSRHPMITHSYPLIDNDMSRSDCVKIVEAVGLGTPPKSACWMCPYTDDTRWVDMRDNDPESFAKAVEFERSAQVATKNRHIAKQNTNGDVYLHASRVPIDQVVFRPKKETDRLLFEEECEGMCGV